jgi:molybdopterin molybdotransferase
MISFQEARSIILSKAHSFGVESVDLTNALERVLAHDVYASRDFPPFNRSMMDGIAINIDDFQNDIKQFKCVETVLAGSISTQELKPGECYKIMTGAALPASANAVIKIEDLAVKDDIYAIMVEGVILHQNIANQGQDVKKDNLAIKKGTLLRAATIGFLASLGLAKVSVEKLPEVRLITTGSEVLDLSEEVLPTHIYNSNKYVIQALLNQNLIQLSENLHVPDDIAALRLNIHNNLLKTDILIISGGVSAGEVDYIPSVLEGLGLKKLFHKVAIKPGKPIWCGVFENKTMVFALPGNPYSCLVTFKLFIEFYVNACLNKSNLEMIPLPINFKRPKPSNLDEFFPVDFNHGGLNKIAINGSGDVRLGFEANALALQTADRKEIQQGELVPCILL